MKKDISIRSRIFGFIMILLFVLPFFSVTFAETDSERLERELKEELARIEKEEAELQKSLNVQKQKSATIERDVNILSNQIQQAQLSINKKNMLIGQLGDDIQLKDQTVQQLNAKMERGKDSLAILIRKTNELDQVSLAEVIVGYESISDFFVNADAFFIIQDSLEKLFNEIREIRGLTEEEKIKLEQKKAAEQDIKAEIEADKRTVQVKESEKKNILAISKQTEKTYEQVIAEKRARATSIRAALFQLRDSAGISFGEAVDYANKASKATGVRAAFILAILKQESDLGKNVGTCNRPGDPETKKWYNIMPGPTHYANYLAAGKTCSGAASPCSWRDDQTIFKRITSNLGLDYESTPLSCPIPGVGGWGGAIGPSQFIPTTWASYESRIASAVGVSTPNPWNPEHAFTATAIYLRDLGASAGGYTAEHTAAAKYYAGSNYTSSYGQSYGNSVMSHAANFQEQLDFLADVD